jgi:hypothetical protein
MNALFGASFMAGAVLELLILNGLIKGSYRKYPVLFTYVLILFFTGIIDATLYFEIGLWTGSARTVFWVNDSIRQVFLFVFVLSLVYQAMASGPGRAAVQRLLIIGSLILAIISYYGMHDARPSAWMTSVIRNMSFCAAIVNLGLWAALLRQKRRDSQILLLSGGLGLQMTGEAIGHSFRNLWQISRTYAVAGNVILVLAHLLCLLAWWQAFRSSRSSTPAKSVKKVEDETFDEAKARRYTGIFQDASI